MNANFRPVFTYLICTLTVFISFYVAYQVSGSIFGKSRIIHLADFGGLTIEGIKNLELWRLLTAQFVHVHQKHMFYNVLSILFLGLILERKIGFKYTLVIWFFAGISGTLFGTQFGSPPWNTGTGSSQAAFGLAGFALMFVIKKVEYGYLMLAALIFALVPALYLDFRAVGYPKPGHCLSLLIGCSIAIYYLYHAKNLPTQLSQQSC